MQTPEDEIQLRRLTSVRTSAIKGDAQNAVVAFTSGSEVWHVLISIDDLATLGRRMVQDAALLKPPADLDERIARVGGY
jgi:hypothetical protein